MNGKQTRPIFSYVIRHLYWKVGPKCWDSAISFSAKCPVKFFHRHSHRCPNNFCKIKKFQIFFKYLNVKPKIGKNIWFWCVDIHFKQTNTLKNPTNQKSTTNVTFGDFPHSLDRSGCVENSEIASFFTVFLHKSAGEAKIGEPNSYRNPDLQHLVFSHNIAFVMHPNGALWHSLAHPRPLDCLVSP